MNMPAFYWKSILLFSLISFATLTIYAYAQEAEEPIPTYKVINYPTPNYDPEKTNDVQGVILHHTATTDIQEALNILTSEVRGVSTHVVIDTDGTRYVMCPPTTVAFHAGKSILGGREHCNEFTIGIEFQGNTLVRPLTQDQIQSGIEYLLPIIKEYNIPIENIVTHEMVRTAFRKKYPKEKCYGKVDITQAEYKKFMTALNAALQNVLP